MVTVSVGVALGVPVASCRAPTEIEVVVTTDFDCADLKDVTVTVGTLGDALESDPPASTSTSCSGGSVGTIVVVPSGSDHAEIGIKVVGGFGVKPAEACAPAPGSSPPDYGVATSSPAVPSTSRRTSRSPCPWCCAPPATASPAARPRPA